MAATDRNKKAGTMGLIIGFLMLTSAFISIMNILQKRDSPSIEGVVACSQLAVAALLLCGSFAMLNRGAGTIYRIACLTGIAFSALAGFASYNRQIVHFGPEAFVYLTSGSVTLIISSLFIALLIFSGRTQNK